MLSPSEVFDLQPAVSREIVGAVWSTHDGDVNWISDLIVDGHTDVDIADDEPLRFHPSWHPDSAPQELA